MGRWPWAGAGCAHGTPWEPRFDRDPDRRGDWETRWTTLRSLHGKCNPMEPLLDTIPNSNIGSTSYPDPPATSFAFLETWTVDDRCLMTPISYQDVNSCGSISWKSCSGIECIYEYTLREEKHGCGRFALRWKIYARRNIDGNLREFSNLNGKSSLEIRVTTSRGRRKHCHGWWTSYRAPGKNLLPVPVSQDRWERSRREAGEKVNHRWKRRFSRSGSGSLVPMGKMVPRLLRLLHTLIYFKRGGRDILSFRGGRVPFTDLFDGYWRSRHRRRTLLPVSQWKQDTYLLLFVGRFLRPLILSHSWEVGWLCVEGSSSSGRVACEGECCVSCYKRKSIHFSIVAPWYEYNVRLLPRSSLEF